MKCDYKHKSIYLFIRAYYEPHSLRLSNRASATKTLFMGFCLPVFRQAGLLQLVNCLTTTRNMRKVFLPRIQQRIASLGIELEGQQSFNH